MPDTRHPTVQLAKQLNETFGVPTMVVMVEPVGDARQAVVGMEMIGPVDAEAIIYLIAETAYGAMVNDEAQCACDVCRDQKTRLFSVMQIMRRSGGKPEGMLN